MEGAYLLYMCSHHSHLFYMRKHPGAPIKLPCDSLHRALATTLDMTIQGLKTDVKIMDLHGKVRM